MQQKDVIYIDVEDDITAIIGKVKASKEKIVALVPPKRTGTLQSAVNLRLLARTADNSSKRLVLITGNAALAGLAASAKIPVAKNLQSRPELAEIPAQEIDDEDIIDGEQLPIGEHASMAEDMPKSMIPASKIDNLDIDGDATPMKPHAGPAAKTAKGGAKKGIKVPNFGSFRKKAALFAGLGILLITFLVWAIWFAPHATVVVSAQTSDQALNMPVTLGEDQQTDADKAAIKSLIQEEKVTQSVEFTATGTKNVGDKATGGITLSNSNTGPVSLSAGTVLTSEGGLNFTLNSAVTVPAGTVSCPTIFSCTGVAGKANGSVTAMEGGAKYNAASGSLSGAPSGVTASFSGSTSGGSDRTATIVLQADVEKAKQQIAQQDSDEMKKKLQEKFGTDAVAIDASFKADGDNAVSSPGVGEETDGKATLTRQMTYTMTGIKKSELNSYLDAAIRKSLSSETKQRVYDNGASNVKFEEFKAGEKTAAVTLSATGQIGPRIEDDQVKEMVKGKRYGEIAADLKAIEGVSDVDVNLSPFWVQGVPDDVNKISIEFKLQKGND